MSKSRYDKFYDAVNPPAQYDSMSSYIYHSSYSLKMRLYGASKVGKSSIAQSLNGYPVDPDSLSHYSSKSNKEFVRISNNIASQNTNMDIWVDHHDTPGFSINSRAIGEQVSIFIYDSTNVDSFNRACELILDTKNNLYSKALLVLFGNKTDLEYQRKIQFEDGKTFADQNNLLFVEGNATKDGEERLQNIFEHIFRQKQRDIENQDYDDSSSISLRSDNSRLKSRINRNYYNYNHRPHFYKIIDEINQSDNLEIKGLISENKIVDGDQLKSHIISEFKKSLSKCEELVDIELLKTNFFSGKKYQILAKGQGIFTRTLGLETDSVKAVNNMLEDAKNSFYNLKRPNTFLGKLKSCFSFFDTNKRPAGALRVKAPDYSRRIRVKRAGPQW